MPADLIQPLAVPPGCGNGLLGADALIRIRALRIGLAAEAVPAVRMFGDHAEAPVAVSSDDDRRVRSLDRLRHLSVPGGIVWAVGVHRLAPQETAKDRDLLRQTLGPLARRPVIVAIGSLGVRRPAGAQADVDPAAGETVHRHDLRRQQRWMPERWDAHECPDSEPRCVACKRAQQRPGLEVAISGNIAVVIGPGAVDTKLLDSPPGVTELVVRVASKAEDSEPERSHDGNLSARLQTSDASTGTP